ncbi:MAG: hypothetical protein JNL67_01935 [Planctomycetaceae bacterium]|nr:hypothetical protein [Planctomycetaceae bacterium]
MAKSNHRSQGKPSAVRQSFHLPSGHESKGEAKQENSIAWSSDRSDDRIDNERSGMDFAVGLAEGDLNSPVADDQWMPDRQLHERSSREFVGQWNRLVSQTNWEKGRVILAWRTALEQEGVPAIEYSDEAWSRLVGGVTGQHVGRLRRVFLRFGKQQATFTGLYWSHFHAAVDWDDAELWLQGAVEKDWSVSQMRHQRWETMGQLAEQKPDPRDVVHGELDEDLEPKDRQESGKNGKFQSSPRSEGPDFGEDSGNRGGNTASLSDDLPAIGDPDRVTMTNENSVANFRPFESAGELPEDFSDLVEDFKLSIIRFKTAGWKDVSKSQLLSVLDGLRYLVESQSDLGVQDEAE